MALILKFSLYTTRGQFYNGHSGRQSACLTTNVHFEHQAMMAWPGNCISVLFREAFPCTRQVSLALGWTQLIIFTLLHSSVLRLLHWLLQLNLLLAVTDLLMDQNHSTTCIKSLSILEAVASILKELALAHSSDTFPHKSKKLKKAPSNAQSIQPFP